MNEYALFIGLIWLITNFGDITTSFHIAQTPCDILLQEGIADSLESCQSMKESASNIIYYFYFSVTIPAVDIVSYFAIINQFNTPFLTRKPMHLAVIIDASKVHFIELKDFKPFLMWKGHMYYLGRGLKGSYGNTYHVFMAHNNQEISSQERNSNKLKALIQSSLAHNDKALLHKPKPSIKFWIRISKDQLVRHWHMYIFQDGVVIEPSKERGSKSIARFKDIEVYFVTKSKDSNQPSTNTYGGYALALMNEQNSIALVQVDSIDIKLEANYSSSFMYMLYEHMRELKEFDKMLNKSWLDLKYIVIFALIGIGGYLAYMVISKWL